MKHLRLIIGTRSYFLLDYKPLLSAEQLEGKILELLVIRGGRPTAADSVYDYVYEDRIANDQDLPNRETITTAVHRLRLRLRAAGLEDCLPKAQTGPGSPGYRLTPNGVRVTIHSDCRINKKQHA